MTSTSLGSRLQLESFTPDHPAGDGDGQAVLLAMTTEHFTLQTARAVTVGDSNGRTALYLGSLSSSLVALALVAQQLRFGDVFLVFVLTVLPALLFLGLVTYVRVLHNSVEDIIYARAINRIRHYYTEIDPTKAHYFLLSGRDDVRGALANMCLRDSWTQFLFTLPSAVAVINGLLAGATAALALAFGPRRGPAAGHGRRRRLRQRRAHPPRRLPGAPLHPDADGGRGPVPLATLGTPASQAPTDALTATRLESVPVAAAGGTGSAAATPLPWRGRRSGATRPKGGAS